MVPRPLWILISNVNDKNGTETNQPIILCSIKSTILFEPAHKRTRVARHRTFSKVYTCCSRTRRGQAIDIKHVHERAEHTDDKLPKPSLKTH